VLDSDDEVFENGDESDEEKVFGDYYRKQECKTTEDMLVNKIIYSITIHYEGSTQPQIHGIITDLDVTLEMKDGGIIKLECDWENSIFVRKNDSLTEQERRIIENLLNQKILIEALEKHLEAFPRLLEGTIQCD
jgi:uncharacterized protein YggL (DUF469 family)